MSALLEVADFHGYPRGVGDEAVRELERRWRQSGDAEDEARWLLARVRGGQLSQAALDAAAWLGAPGAVRAAPTAAERPREGDPWELLLLWCAGLDSRLETLPEASHRATLAEAERLLALLDRPRGQGSQLLVVDGAQAGERFELVDTLHLDRHGRLVEPAAAAVSLQTDADGVALQARPEGGVRVNEEPVSSGRLFNGDLLCPGDEGVLLAYQGGADDQPGVRIRVRAWIDELSARAAEQRGAPAGPALLALSGRPSAAAARWLHAQLPALEAAIDERRSLALWPAHLSPPAELRQAWVPAIRATLRDAVAPWLLGQRDPLRARAASAPDRPRIAVPCSVRWDELSLHADDRRVRSCDHCQLQAFDVAHLTREEAAALIAARSGGRLCVRLYQREDGRVMTRECATVPREEEA